MSDDTNLEEIETLRAYTISVICFSTTILLGVFYLIEKF